MAYSMVAVYGMDSELGLVSYGQNNSSQQFYKPYSASAGSFRAENLQGGFHGHGGYPNSLLDA